MRSSPQAFVTQGIQVFIGYPPNSKCNFGNNNNFEAMDVDDGITAASLGFDGMDISSGDGLKYKSIRLERLEGKNFLNKMEILMAVLADVS